MATSAKFSPKSLLGTLAAALLAAASLVACGGGGEDSCNSFASCKALDDEDDGGPVDIYKGCWHEGVDAPIFGMASCEAITREQARTVK